MRYSPVLSILSAAIFILFLSCHKKGTEERSVPTVLIPHGNHPAVNWMMMAKAISTTPRYSLIQDAWGAFIAEELTGSLEDTAGHVNNINLKWEEAIFTKYQAFNDAVNTVTINNVPLQSSGFLPSYVLVDSTGVWNSNANNNWQLSDYNLAIIVNANVTGPFPGFTGTLPDSVSRQNNFSYTFSAANCSNADSAYLVLISDDYKLQSNVVRAGAGIATIAASRMQPLQNLYFGQYSSVYWGGVIKLVLYNHTFQTFAGKRYTFVNQKEILGKVVFY